MIDLKKIIKKIENHEKRIAEIEFKLKGKNRITKNSSSDSVSDYLLELRSNGFFKKPKLFNEVLKELERKGHPCNRTSLSKPLLKAVQQNVLDRVGEKGDRKSVV